MYNSLYDVYKNYNHKDKKLWEDLKKELCEGDDKKDVESLKDM